MEMDIYAVEKLVSRQEDAGKTSMVADIAESMSCLRLGDRVGVWRRGLLFRPHAER
jgi:hypothetical protein